MNKENIVWTFAMAILIGALAFGFLKLRELERQALEKHQWP
jgi:hypothetical protein